MKETETKLLSLIDEVDKQLEAMPLEVRNIFHDRMGGWINSKEVEWALDKIRRNTRPTTTLTIEL